MVIQLMSAGTGLTGEYFDDRGFGSLRMTRVDPQINFDWGRGGVDDALSRNRNSIRWTGQIEAPQSGQYTIHGTASDGIRVWVNDEKVFGVWSRGRHEREGVVTLDAGRRYDVRVEYMEYKRRSFVKLEWSSDTMERSVIPTSALYPTAEPVTSAPPPTPVDQPPPVIEPEHPETPEPTPPPVPQSPIYSFSLINADTDHVIVGYETLSDGVTLNFSTLPTRNLNIRANATSDVLGVRFTYDGNTPFPIQHNAPFAMADNKGANYYAWTPAAGVHVLIATPYDNHPAIGSPMGLARSLTFSVVEA